MSTHNRANHPSRTRLDSTFQSLAEPAVRDFGDTVITQKIKSHVNQSTSIVQPRQAFGSTPSRWSDDCSDHDAEPPRNCFPRCSRPTGRLIHQSSLCQSAVVMLADRLLNAVPQLRPGSERDDDCGSAFFPLLIVVVA